MSRTCDGGACVVVARRGDTVYVSSTLQPDREEIPISIIVWREQVTTAHQSGHLDIECFFAGHGEFYHELTSEEIKQFEADVLAGEYDFAAPV